MTNHEPMTSGERTDLIQRLREAIQFAREQFDSLPPSAALRVYWDGKESGLRHAVSELEASPSASEEAPQAKCPECHYPLVDDPNGHSSWCSQSSFMADHAPAATAEAPAAERARVDDASKDTHYMRVAVAAWEKSQAELDWQKVLVAQLEEKVADYERMVMAYKGRAEMAEEALAEAEQTIATLRAALEGFVIVPPPGVSAPGCACGWGAVCEACMAVVLERARGALARPSAAPTGAPTP